MAATETETKNDVWILREINPMPDAQPVPEPVLYTINDGIATITLNRPAVMNAMTNGLMRGISEALARVVADDSIRVVVLTGAGRGFCSGADLAEAAGPPARERASDAPTEVNSAGTRDPFNTAMRAVMDCPVPTIARVNGPAAGGGFGLALACDITVAAASAFFVATFSPRLGVVPDMGATWSIPLRVGRARALGITLLGDRISAAQALEWGLIWSAVADDELDDEVARIAAVLKRSSPSTVRRTRETIDAAIHNSFSDQLDLEMAHQAVLISRNMRQGALAFLEKREPEFGGERD
ncbi:MAG: enoyl-CoA hydratase-related protein [Pseudomonadales bacterium]|jgi:2-(1,2-epoxy-1,2-dihydrophenyl)acetyl-CoA isomerase|nr:enoyl-CoA hydratase-related protein [Pseudomonadales bacterium]MDP7596452.1 enoyl-CoA hydratase-related protein [Pseudomonadales bacterium]HJN52828.1 enoyl-CoA hydratase-related protein [Pseudomonadales bacterium]|tara:strand:+ start:946 stop:1836 length:891 start_codon:yes stop_codon:yes gene_type:complete